MSLRDDESRPLLETRKSRFCFYFCVLALANLLCFCDLGIIGSSIHQLEFLFCISPTTIGFLSLFRDLGQITTALYFGAILQTKTALGQIRFVCCLMPLMWVLFAASSEIRCRVNRELALVTYGLSRFVFGACQGGFFAYFLLWVQSFAPLPMRTLCVSVVFTGIAVGFAIGYIVTLNLNGEFRNDLTHLKTWAYVNYGCALLFFCSIVFVVFGNPKNLDVFHKIEKTDSTESNKNFRDVWIDSFRLLRELFKSLTWICLALSASLMTFCRVGNSSWFPIYALEYYKLPDNTVLHLIMWMGSLSTVGGIAGGITVDKCFGAHKTKRNWRNILILFISFATVSAICGYLLIFDSYTITHNATLCTFFTTGFSIPGIYGIINGVIPSETRAMAVTLTRALQVLLGNILAQFLPVILAKKEGLGICWTPEPTEIIEVKGSILEGSDRFYRSIQLIGCAATLTLVFLCLSLWRILVRTDFGK